jgi:hypothetical protein
MKTPLKIVIILAIAVLVTGYFVIHSFFQTPQAAFKRFIAKPIPISVHSLEEGHFLAMDSTFWALHFQISKMDLDSILNTQHFAPIEENPEFKEYDQKEKYLFYWKERIYSSAKLDVNLANSWQIVFLKEVNGTKYFFFDTNSTEAVFVAEAH